MGTLVGLGVGEHNLRAGCATEVSYRRGVYVRHAVLSLILPLENVDLHKQLAPVVVLKWILISPVEAPSEIE